MQNTNADKAYWSDLVCMTMHKELCVRKHVPALSVSSMQSQLPDVRKLRYSTPQGKRGKAVFAVASYADTLHLPKSDRQETGKCRALLAPM